MRRNRAPEMTAAEFRAVVDGRDLTVTELAEMFHRTPRAIKSYYYGERPVPNHVALVLTNLPVPDRTMDEPWWAAAMDRFARVAQSQSNRERSGMRKAIAAYCAGCEPEGTCRTPSCALRDFSPLPLIQVGRRKAA